MAKHPIHPAADIFPMLPPDELDALADDIKENGLRVAIILDKEGRVLDGRNRLAACAKAKVEPTFVTEDIDDPVSFVASLNAKRRNLSPGQKAMAAALAWDLEPDRRKGPKGGKTDLAKNFQKEDDGRAARLAKQFASNREYVKQARAVENYDKGLADAVKNGKVMLGDAYEQVPKASTRKGNGEDPALADLRAADAELADAVMKGTLDLDEAVEKLAERKEAARMERLATMSNLQNAVMRLHHANVEELADAIWNNWDRDLWPTGPVKLDVQTLERSAEVLRELAKRLKKDPRH
jgi:hypothetical protein